MIHIFFSIVFFQNNACVAFRFVPTFDNIYLSKSLIGETTCVICFLLWPLRGGGGFGYLQDVIKCVRHPGT